jgi:hypothetical protein
VLLAVDAVRSRELVAVPPESAHLAPPAKTSSPQTPAIQRRRELFGASATKSAPITATPVSTRSAPNSPCVAGDHAGDACTTSVLCALEAAGDVEKTAS